MKIKQLPESERPRERLLKQGSDALSLTELLAIILGSGTQGKSVIHLAQEVLSTFPNLQETSIQELLALKGLGKAKAIQLKAALTLSQRLQEPMPSKERVTTPDHVFQLLKNTLGTPEKKSSLSFFCKT